jgi:hypothetical protein
MKGKIYSEKYVYKSLLLYINDNKDVILTVNIDNFLILVNSDESLVGTLTSNINLDEYTPFEGTVVLSNPTNIFNNEYINILYFKLSNDKILRLCGTNTSYYKNDNNTTFYYHMVDFVDEPFLNITGAKENNNIKAILFSPETYTILYKE